MKTLVQFTKFGIVGISNTVVSYGVYSYLVYIGLPYLISNIAGFIAAVTNSFFWNNKYVFKKSKNERRNPISVLVKTFIAYASTGLVINTFLLYLFIEKFNISKYFAPLLCFSITVPINFLLNKIWAFKSVKGDTNG